MAKTVFPCSNGNSIFLHDRRPRRVGPGQAAGVVEDQSNINVIGEEQTFKLKKAMILYFVRVQYDDTVRTVMLACTSVNFAFISIASFTT